MRKKSLYPVNLHFFGHDGDGAGAAGGEGSGTGEAGKEGSGEGGTGEGGSGKEQDPPKTKTFDEILKEGSYQAEFDRRVQKALGTAKEKWSALMDDKLSEAEKLSKMNKEEKTEYMRQKQEKELLDRESAITRRELMAEAKNTLSEKRLPVELAEVLNYRDADSCNKSITAIETAFQKALEAGIQERLKGGTPIKKATQTAAYTKEQVATMTPEEINENWEAISNSMKDWK